MSCKNLNSTLRTGVSAAPFVGHRLVPSGDFERNGDFSPVRVSSNSGPNRPRHESHHPVVSMAAKDPKMTAHDGCHGPAPSTEPGLVLGGQVSESI